MCVAVSRIEQMREIFEKLEPMEVEGSMVDIRSAKVFFLAYDRASENEDCNLIESQTLTI